MVVNPHKYTYRRLQMHNALRIPLAESTAKNIEPHFSHVKGTSLRINCISSLVETALSGAVIFSAFAVQRSIMPHCTYKGRC